MIAQQICSFFCGDKLTGDCLRCGATYPEHINLPAFTKAWDLQRKRDAEAPEPKKRTVKRSKPGGR